MWGRVRARARARARARVGVGVRVRAGVRVGARHTVALASVVPLLYLPAAQFSHFEVLAPGAIVPGAQGICLALPVVA